MSQVSKQEADAAWKLAQERWAVLRLEIAREFMRLALDDRDPGDEDV